MCTHVYTCMCACHEQSTQGKNNDCIPLINVVSFNVTVNIPEFPDALLPTFFFFFF